MPDRTLLLVLDEHEAGARADLRDGGKNDRFARKGAKYHRAVAQSFDALAAASPGRFRRVSASGTPDEVTERLLAALEGLA